MKSSLLSDEGGTPRLKRYRARIEGGYRRKTLSLPTELVRWIEAQLSTKPGLTISAFVSDELERVRRRNRRG
jgi:hypothetical protein